MKIARCEGDSRVINFCFAEATAITDAEGEPCEPEPAMVAWLILRSPHGNLWKRPLMEVGRG
jgi:hypothetical protein